MVESYVVCEPQHLSFLQNGILQTQLEGMVVNYITI